jgi:hypothetical protein
VSTVVFNATVQDPAAPTTVYGKGHQASLTDEAFVRALLMDGKAALMGATIRNARMISRTATTAQLGFTVDQPCTAMAANYGTTTAYGSTQAATPASGSGDVVVNLAGLTTATLYHYRITVTVGTAVSLTGDLTFTTA